MALTCIYFDNKSLKKCFFYVKQRMVKSYKADAKSIIRQSQQDFFRWEADIIIKQADITFHVLQKKQK